MPFTYSITDGIGAGFISYTVIQIFVGRARNVHWMMYLSALLFLIYFAISPLTRLLGIG
jgi:AGZA family xanthine/uracil permease-like MFS transporter